MFTNYSLCHLTVGFFFVVLNLAQTSGYDTSAPILVLFGRPGAGKTTLATSVVKNYSKCCLVDLDECISDEIRENFSRGIYPTSEERVEFMNGACDYLELKIAKSKERFKQYIVPFSFVNSDLREVFRKRFPDAEWVFLNTSENLSKCRILERRDHFYKGEPKSINKRDADQEQWKFANVNFRHIEIDGEYDIESNCQFIINIFKKWPQLQPSTGGESEWDL